MVTKRKRASFSPTITVDTVSKKSPAKEDAPVLQQVVEVVVEEPTPKEERTAPQIHIVLPKEQENIIEDEILDEEDTVRIKHTHPVQKEEVVGDTPVEIEEEEEEPPRHHEVKHYVKAEKVVEEEVKEEVEEVSSPEPEGDEEESQEESEEKQKETVAELFGKNSDALMPEITVHKSSNTKSLVIWAVTMVAIAVGVGGGLVVFTNRSNQSQNTPIASVSPTPESSTVTQTVSPTVAPTATPKVTTKPVAKKDLKIQIQNGGGVAGAGSKMKALLESKGYKVADVGNASSYTYEETEINVKESKADIRDTLEEDVSESYTVGKIESTLPETSQYDVRVIVGKK